MARKSLLVVFVAAFLVCLLFASLGLRAAFGELTSLTPAGMVVTTVALVGAPACAYRALRLFRPTHHA